MIIKLDQMIYEMIVMKFGILLKILKKISIN